MLKMLVNGVPWSLLNELAEVPKCLECPSVSSSRVTLEPGLLECIECVLPFYDGMNSIQCVDLELK